MLCSSVVRLKRKGNYFKWFEIIISSLALSLTFQLKANDCVWSNFVYLFTYANERREFKTKDSVYNTHLNFWSFFSGKKCALYTGKYGSYANFFGEIKCSMGNVSACGNFIVNSVNTNKKLLSQLHKCRLLYAVFHNSLDEKESSFPDN